MPQLLVSDLNRSLAFWCALCGFSARYSRLENGFAYVVLGTAHVMLEQAGAGWNWCTGALDPPLGRGINLQINVPKCLTIAETLRVSGTQLFMEPDAKWYRVDEHKAGVQQFLVTDAGGYLLRFQSSLGHRSVSR